MLKVVEEIKYFTDKRFSTLAGTLVYFLLMSVTPFLFWLVLIVGEIDFSIIDDNEIFAAVTPVLEYLQTSAKGATGGAGIILLVTSLWSSTNFFYHLRRSGEIIYDSRIKKGGLSLRFSSLMAVFAAIVLIAFATAVPFLGLGVLAVIMPEWLAQCISIIFLTLSSFFIALLLNIFACPYNLGFENTVQGVLLTVALWLVFAVGFTIYLRYANPQRLYGAIAAVIVFLLWCYLMVNSLVIGIIYNRKNCMPHASVLRK